MRLISGVNFCSGTFRLNFCRLWKKGKTVEIRSHKNFVPHLIMSSYAKLYKSEQIISRHIAGWRKLNDLNLGEVLYLPIICNISDSWLNLMKGCLNHFRSYDSENQQLFIVDNVTILQELILLSCKEMPGRNWYNPLINRIWSKMKRQAKIQNRSAFIWESQRYMFSQEKKLASLLHHVILTITRFPAIRTSYIIDRFSHA